MERLTRALNRNKRGWGLVRWVSSSYPSVRGKRVIYVQDGEETYPAMLRHLKDPVLLSRKVKMGLGIHS